MITAAARAILCVFLCVVACGCSVIPSNQKISYVGYVSKEIPTLYDIKREFFTEDALAAIDHIPCVDAPSFVPFVTGVNFWSNFAGLILTGTTRRQCVIDMEVLESSGPLTVIHEYIHHLDDMSRDREISLISYVEFDCALERLSRDKKWREIFEYGRSSLFTDIFGIGWRSEEMAYIGSYMAYYQVGPEYMWRVFRKILRRN